MLMPNSILYNRLAAMAATPEGHISRHRGSAEGDRLEAPIIGASFLDYQTDHIP